jgi:hypothetical protein
MPDFVQISYGTAMTRAVEGALADNGEHLVDAYYNQEASARIAFGRAVKRGTVDGGAKLPSSENDVIAGIVLHTDDYQVGSGAGELYQAGTAWTNGVGTGGKLSVLVKGTIWAVARTAVTPGDRLWVRAVSSESGTEFLGGLEDADDSTDTIDCTKQGQWLDTAAAGELARLRVDFTAKP